MAVRFRVEESVVWSPGSKPSPTETRTAAKSGHTAFMMGCDLEMGEQSGRGPESWTCGIPQFFCFKNPHASEDIFSIDF